LSRELEKDPLLMAALEDGMSPEIAQEESERAMRELSERHPQLQSWRPLADALGRLSKEELLRFVRQRFAEGVPGWQASFAARSLLSVQAAQCDICNSPFEASPAQGSVYIPFKQFALIAQAGYNPFARGRADPLEGYKQAMRAAHRSLPTRQADTVAARLTAHAVVDAVRGAMSPDADYRRWKENALDDRTDWALCASCAEDVKNFLGVSA
jgi:hypothetical protein